MTFLELPQSLTMDQAFEIRAGVTVVDAPIVVLHDDPVTNRTLEYLVKYGPITTKPGDRLVGVLCV